MTLDNGHFLLDSFQTHGLDDIAHLDTARHIGHDQHNGCQI